MCLKHKTNAEASNLATHKKLGVFHKGGLLEVFLCGFT